MAIARPPTFDGESDVQRYIDEARLYIEQFPNENDEKRVLRLSTGLNGPLRDTILRHFDRKTGPEALFGALRGACSKREMPPVHELHGIKMGPNEPCALFAERLKSRWTSTASAASSRPHDTGRGVGEEARRGAAYQRLLEQLVDTAQAAARASETSAATAVLGVAAATGRAFSTADEHEGRRPSA